MTDISRALPSSPAMVGDDGVDDCRRRMAWMIVIDEWRGQSSSMHGVGGPRIEGHLLLPSSSSSAEEQGAGVTWARARADGAARGDEEAEGQG